MVSRILVLVILIVVCSSIGIIADTVGTKRSSKQRCCRARNMLRKTLLRLLSRTDHLRLFVAALGATADLSAHSHSQLVVPSHCLCTYTDDAFAVRPCPTNWLPCLLLPDKSRCTYLTSILTYHMLRVVKSFSFCTIGWTNNDPYRPRRKCSVLLHIPKTTENDPTILSVSIMPTWSRLMC